MIRNEMKLNKSEGEKSRNNMKKSTDMMILRQ